jgi:hypothetical protein
MILNQLTAFALLSSSHLLGQAGVTAPEKPADAATKANPPAEARPAKAPATPTAPAAEGPSADGSAEANEESAAAATDEAPAAAEPAPGEPADEAAEAAAPSAEAAPEPAPQASPEPEPEEAAPAPINPRPEGEAERLGKHPVDYEAITFKPGTGVVFTSKDKLFSLGMRLRAQFRADLMSEKVGDADTEVSQVFGIPRARLFDAYAISEQVGVQKPDAHMFTQALTQLGLAPKDYGRTVMVGNNLARDIKGANAIGMISVWLDWAPRRAKVPADDSEIPQFTIKEPLELLSVLALLG